MAHRHFTRGQAVFKCATCGRSTRITTQANGSALCSQCDELAMQENSILDKCQTVEECAAFRDEMVADAVKHGGDAALIRKNFATLWEGR